MTDNNVEIWNAEATRKLKSYDANLFLNHTENTYLRAVEIGLKFVNSNRIKVLKTDLWDEGIEHWRDILSRYQNSEYFDLYGVDISPVVCSSAMSRVKNVHVVQGDIRNLPFKNDFFDIILDLSTIDHVPENHVMDVLQEYKRVVNKSGILVLIFWYNSFFVKYIMNAREDDKQYYFTLRTVKNNVKKDFDILEEYCISFFPRPESKINILPASIRNQVLNLEYSRWVSLIFKNFAGLYLIIGRKK